MCWSNMAGVHEPRLYTRITRGIAIHEEIVMMYSRKAMGDHLFTYSPVAVVQPLARVTTTPKLTIPANAAMTTELMAAFSISSYLIQSRCTDFLPKMEKTADCHQLSTDLCALLAQSSELLRIHHSHTALQGCTIVGWYRRRRKEIPWRILCLLNLQCPGPTAVWLALHWPR